MGDLSFLTNTKKADYPKKAPINPFGVPEARRPIH